LALFFAQISHAQAAYEIRLAKQNLLVLQAKSFQYDREYCGYLVVDARDVISGNTNRPKAQRLNAAQMIILKI
jgi:hypothetical protein